MYVFIRWCSLLPVRRHIRIVESCTFDLRPTLMGTKNLNENGPNPFFLFGTKNMVRAKLMAKVLFRHGFAYLLV